jgi:hypothetical protein
MTTIDEARLRCMLPSINASNLARILALPEEMSDVCSIRHELQQLNGQLLANNQ